MKQLLMISLGLGLFVIFGLVGHIEQQDLTQMNQDTTQQFDPHALSN